MSSVIAEVADSTQRLFENSGAPQSSMLHSPSAFFARPNTGYDVSPEAAQKATAMARLTPEETPFNRMAASDVIFAAKGPSFANDRAYTVLVSPEAAQQITQAAMQTTTAQPPFERNIGAAVNAFFNSALAQKANIAVKPPKETISDAGLSTAKAAFFGNSCASAVQQDGAAELAISMPIR